MELKILATPFNVEPADVLHVLELEIIQLLTNDELKARYNNIPLLKLYKITYARMNFPL